MTPNETDIAWLAGFFDGEGTIGAHEIYNSKRPSQSKRPYIQVGLSNTHLPSLEEARRIIGYGVVHRRKLIDGRQQVYTLQFNAKDDVVRFLTRVLPYLRVKREQAILALTLLEEIDTERRRVIAVTIKAAKRCPVTA